MKTREEFTCPLDLTHDILKGKWKPIIIWCLRHSGLSLSDLKKSISGISQKMLLEQLKELQEFDFVGKNEFSGYPLKVEYYLKDRGWKILEAIKTMQEIGIDIMKQQGKEDFLRKKGLL